MKITTASRLEKRENGDLLVLPFWEGPTEAGDFSQLKKSLRLALESGDFQGKLGEGAIVYSSEEKEKRVLLLGLGKEKEVTAESLRKAFAKAVGIARGKKTKALNLLVPQTSQIPKDALIRGVSDGVFLSNYSFDELKSKTLKEAPPLLEKICWIGFDAKQEGELKRYYSIVEGVCFARDLVNGNADDITPAKLGQVAQEMEKRSSKLKTTVFDKKWLEERKMGLILAVSRGSNLDPCLIQVAYRGNPRSKEQIVLVGKGVTYDSGGLALKPADGMVTMKCDMAGAAAVLGTVRTAADLDLKINVTALVPAVENSIDAKSYKNGDVYRSYSGTTVEIVNTDAEGRLILADALAYAADVLKPTCLVDVATLTGSIVMALGDEIAGVFCDDNRLLEGLLKASSETGELVWRMPLHPEYKESMKSDIADIINSGGREAGALKAALFLREFVSSVPWAHIDVAGTAFWTKPKYYHPTKATGYGVRLLVEFLKTQLPR